MWILAEIYEFLKKINVFNTNKNSVFVFSSGCVNQNDIVTGIFMKLVL